MRKIVKNGTGKVTFKMSGEEWEMFLEMVSSDHVQENYPEFHDTYFGAIWEQK